MSAMLNTYLANKSYAVWTENGAKLIKVWGWESSIGLFETQKHVLILYTFSNNMSSRVLF